MRVVHLVPAMEQGGVENVVLSLNRLLVKAGHESIVISRGGRLVAQIEADGGRHIACDLRSKNPLTAYFRALRLRRLLKGLGTPAAFAVGTGQDGGPQGGRAEGRKSRWAEEPLGGRAEGPQGGRAEGQSGGRGAMLVCAHSRVPAWLFRIANRGLGLRWITYAHGANSVSRYSAVMTSGDLVVTPSNFLADFLKEHYPDSPRLAERLRVIHPAVDFSRFDAAKLDGEFLAAKRKEWGISEGDFVTMSIGRITPSKGFEFVIRDFASAAADGGPRRLVIVGAADEDHQAYRASLKALAAELGVADRTVFAGQQSKMPECLFLASEVVSGNQKKPESFGLSVVEAYAMKRPVRLLKHFGGAAEIVDTVARSGAADCRAAVQAMCAEEKMVARTLAVYREVLGNE